MKLSELDKSPVMITGVVISQKQKSKNDLQEGIIIAFVSRYSTEYRPRFQPTTAQIQSRCAHHLAISIIDVFKSNIVQLNIFSSCQMKNLLKTLYMVK